MMQMELLVDRSKMRKKMQEEDEEEHTEAKQEKEKKESKRESMLNRGDCLDLRYGCNTT